VLPGYLNGYKKDGGWTLESKREAHIENINFGDIDIALVFKAINLYGNIKEGRENKENEQERIFE
jgi:hypothetical protein